MMRVREMSAGAGWATRVRLTAVAAVCAATLAAAGAADAATLRWKFKAGETLKYQMVQTTQTQLSVKANNQEIKTTNTQTIDMSWKVTAVAADGTADITQTIDRMQTKIESAFGNFEYDSKANKEPEGAIAQTVVPTLKLLVGSSFNYKMSPRGELSSVEIPKGLVDKLREASPQAAAAAGSIFTEDGLKNMIHESSLALPEGDLAQGKSWSRPTKMPPSPIGTMTLDKTYTYQGPGDGGEKLGLKVVIKLEPAENKAVDIKIADQDGTGTFIFDNNAGRVLSSNVTEKIKMTISVQNQLIEQSTETTSVMKYNPGSN